MKTIIQKNNLIISSLIVVFTLFAYLDSYAQVPLSGNTVNSVYDFYNSALGFGNTAWTDSYYSTAGGQNSTVHNSYYSLAFGKNAYTEGRAAFALGEYARSEEGYSFAFGRYITADASKCFVFGTGTGSGDGQILTNNVENSFLVGFDNKKMLMVKKRTGFLGSGEEYGLVGINTDTPQYELDVVGTANVEQFRLPTNATSGYVLVSDADGLATWQDKSSPWLGGSTSDIHYLSGNVGIGTNTPVDRLDVEGTFRVQDDFRIDGNIVQYDEALYFTSENLDGGAIGKSSEKSLLTLTDDGYVGIGTSTPSEILDVDGTMKSTNIQITGLNLSTSQELLMVTNNGSVVNTESLLIRSDGAIGIGAMNNSSHKLKVFGTVGLIGLSIDGLSGNGNAVLRIDNNGLVSTIDPITFADNMGDHTATQNINLNGKWLSGDGGANGLYIGTNGDLGFGTSNIPIGYRVAVNGKIIATELKIAEYGSVNWADFVFAENYKLRSLQDVEEYINQHKSLPDVPSAKDVEENGYEVAQMDATLLQKIEELTLYVIEQQKKIEKLENQIINNN